MKRRIVAVIAAAACLGAISCSNQADAPGDAAPPSAAAGWDQPPRIEGVTRQGGTVIVRGTAGRGSRVVLRGLDGSATAAAADRQGRFEIRLTAPVGDVLLTPEVQNGEVAAPSPERLAILAGGPIALLSPGEPALRLDAAGTLDVIDTDGSVMVLGGRAAGAPPAVRVGGDAATVMRGREGRWRATIGGGGPATVVIGERTYGFPGAGEASADAFVVARAGAGWRIDWTVPPSGRQSTWLPDE